MLAGVHSLGTKFGIIQRLERQAGDWEPFGDLLLEIPNSEGTLIRCGGSVKSNRLVNTNGCDSELCAGMWTTMAKPVFAPKSDFVLLISAPLSAKVADHLSNLHQQASSIDAERLDQKIVHANLRKIYESFRKVGDATAKGLPGNVLARLLHREFDFEATVSRSEMEALKCCRDILRSEDQHEEKTKDLWKRLCEIAQDTRISGGAYTRAEISAKIREKFNLQDDPCDTAGWTRIRKFSQDGMDEIETSLAGNIKLPRKAENAALRAAIDGFRACHVLGDSGSGKSSLIKTYATEIQTKGAEVVWIKADRYNVLASAIPDLLEILLRCRRTSALLVIDALEGSTSAASFGTLARLISGLSGVENSNWSVVLTCQTPDWARVSIPLVKHLAGHAVLTKDVECGPLSKEDFDFMCATSPTVAHLVVEPKLRKLLATPKMLDVLLSGQLAENRAIAGESDLVEWWWDQQVRGNNAISAEERVARDLAGRMADELRSELPADSVAGAESAADQLIRNRVLKRSHDGLLRFEHDLLADWARVMHLRGLGHEKLNFIRAHTENPPWIRAVRLLSQHLLDRVVDLGQWRDFLSVSREVVRPQDEPSANNLQIIDAWLEGIIFSVNPTRVLADLSEDLFDHGGWLLRRLIRRLLLVATIPDPVIQKHCAEIDAKMAEAAATRYRLPLWGTWSPVVTFLISHKDRATDIVPVELGEIAEMWARMEDYVQLEWSELAELIIYNSEKELRREIRGEYRHESGPRSLGAGNNSRKTIYSGALFAATQSAERVARLVTKAAGITPWEDVDISPGVRDAWLGEWSVSRSMYGGGSYVEMPPASWPGGPMRETSSDFFQAWFESGSSIRLFRKSPAIACDATMGFLLDWPKRTLHGHYDTSIDGHGFASEADDMYPTCYTKGPFLQFLRVNWVPALHLIVRLTNFATERYTDWWPYDDKPSLLSFPTGEVEAEWIGNHQIYGWFRFNMNTVQVVTCALMALEKYLEELVTKNESIESQVQTLYMDGCSLAFAGLLIGIGKRHPELFLKELKPLLFVRDLYLFDMQIVGKFTGGGYWPHDGEFMNNIRREWDNLPGRQTSLLELAQQWFVTREEFRPLLSEVANAWRNIAAGLPDNSEEKLPLIRWAATFDLSNYKNISFKDGSTGWQYEQPKEIRDEHAEAAHLRHQALLMLPHQCSDMLEKRTNLNHEQCKEIWDRLHNWTAYVQATKQWKDDDEFASSLRDHRHARAGLIAVLLCLGGNWLDADSEGRPWVEAELRQILDDPPNALAFGADDSHDDCEGFLARSVVQCWVHSPGNEKWRGFVGHFVASYRYRTIKRLFEEAFLQRIKLGEKFRELEGLVLSFAAVRQKAQLEGFKPQPKLISQWVKRWIPIFARGGRGPKWTDDWRTIEIEKPFPPSDASEGGRRRKKRRRRNYGLDMAVILAAFGTLPSISDARNDDESRHWLSISKQMLSSYLRTLPSKGSTVDEEEEWLYEIWRVDREIIKIIAALLFQCTPEMQRDLWTPILDLPPAAHHHITNFLSSVLIETISSQTPRVTELIPLWRAMIQHLFASPKWTGKLRHQENDVWKYLFFYGGSVSSVRDKDHVSLVAALHDLFERHVQSIGQNSHAQSAFAGFVVSDAGDQLLVDTLEWLNPYWQTASSYFWEGTAKCGHFEDLLRKAWKKHFSVIRRRPEALKAFKTLTLNLASQQVATAVEIQNQIGGL